MTGFSLEKHTVAVPKAVDGNLDLSKWDFSSQGIAKLDGEWEFYWGELLRYTDFYPDQKYEKTGVLKVPGIWNNYQLGNLSLPGHGYATFRLRMKVKKRDEILALKIPVMASAYSLWINGVLLSSNGTVGRTADDTIAQRLPRVVTFTPPAEHFDIILQVSNFHHREGGIWYNLYLGTNLQIMEKREFDLAFELFLLGSLVIMGLYHFILYLLRKQDKLTLYFGIVCCSLTVRTMFTGETFFIRLFPDFNFMVGYKLEYLSFYTGVIFFIMFISALFPEDVSRHFTRAAQYITSLFIVFVLAASTTLTSYSLIPFELFTVIGVLYLSFVFITAIIKKREGAVFVLAGASIYFITVLNDILYSNEMIPTGYVAPFGFFIFIFSQSVILSIRFSKAFTAVEALSERLLSMDILKDEFLANTSHELRTPLNGIIGIAESLIDGAAGPLNDSQERNLNMVVLSGKRLASLINDILDFSKLKNNELDLNRKAVSLRPIADIILSVLYPFATKKSLELYNEISDDLPPIYADENRLQQILYNLVGNAIKFTEAGSVKLTAGIITGEKEHVEIKVADTGIGISEEHFTDIFQQFEQIDSSAARQYGGTGLGLAITKQLIELQGGNIRVESELGKGATFIFSLPVFGSLGNQEIQHIVVPSENEATHGLDNLAGRILVEKKLIDKRSDKDRRGWKDRRKPSPALPAAPITLQKDAIKIMVVDDEPINLQVLNNILSMQGYSVIEAGSGTDAISLIKQNNEFDLILLDVMMPRMSGFEVCRTLRENFSVYELPIIMLTAKNQISDIIMGLEVGANDYISKPFDKRELLARVETLMTLKKAVKEHSQLISIKQELDVARRIQLSILPEKPPAMEGFDIRSCYIPTASIGGDFFDFHIIDEHKLGALISDVSGHGIPAALIAAMVKIAFSLQKNNADDTVKLITSMNETLCGKLESNFLTAGYVFLDLKRNKLVYSNAGHLPLLLVGKNSSIRELKPRGKIIGWFEKNEFTSVETDIESGDRIIMYTDGITECMNKEYELFGDDRFYDIIKISGNLSAQEFIESVISSLMIWNGQFEKFNDDVTMVVVDIK